MTARPLPIKHSVTVHKKQYEVTVNQVCLARCRQI
jgi:hypothetical protein